MAHPFDDAALQRLAVDDAGIAREVERRFPERVPDPDADRERLRRVVALLDLTTLRGDERVGEIESLCRRAVHPLRAGDLHTAGVCVFPEHVGTARRVLAGTSVRVAGACFGPDPGADPLEGRLSAIERSLEAGAEEIDVVITLALAVAGDWPALHDEVCRFREAAGSVTLKVILGTGVLPDLTAVARASRVALAAGADFIKTSTGREPVNATLPAGIVMAGALNEHAARTGTRRGLKPAGGIRTAAAALDWLQLADADLGEDWATPERFRIGASSLLDDLVHLLHIGVTP